MSMSVRSFQSKVELNTDGTTKFREFSLSKSKVRQPQSAAQDSFSHQFKAMPVPEFEAPSI